MSAPVLVGIALLGGAGAIARFLLDGHVSARAGRGLPYGTFVVNILGSLLLGACVGVALGVDAYRLAGTGFIGAFTTFSTWTFESHRLGEDARLGAGVLNLLVSLLAGIAAAWLGRHLGAAL
jgi:CrcB protein